MMTGSLSTNDLLALGRAVPAAQSGVGATGFDGRDHRRSRTGLHLDLQALQRGDLVQDLAFRAAESLTVDGRERRILIGRDREEASLNGLEAIVRGHALGLFDCLLFDNLFGCLLGGSFLGCGLFGCRLRGRIGCGVVSATASRQEQTANGDHRGETLRVFAHIFPFVALRITPGFRSDFDNFGLRHAYLGAFLFL
jgi:hypothetical protein